jgi:chromosome segregation ATPase
VNLNKRIADLTEENEYYLETLNELKGKYHTYEQDKFNKKAFLEGIKLEKQEMDQSLELNEQEISILRIKITSLEIQLGELGEDKTNYQQQIVDLNKSREEIRSIAEERAREISMLLNKIADIEDHNLHYID